MEKELLGTGCIGSMTAHALSWHKRSFQNRLLLEAVDIPLVNAYLAICFISRSELAVGHAIIVERILADKDHERTELLPSAVLVASHRNGKRVAHIGFSDLMPLAHIETGISALCCDAVAVSVADLGEYL